MDLNKWTSERKKEETTKACVAFSVQRLVHLLQFSCRMARAAEVSIILQPRQFQANLQFHSELQFNKVNILQLMKLRSNG